MNHWRLQNAFRPCVLAVAASVTVACSGVSSPVDSGNNPSDTGTGTDTTADVASADAATLDATGDDVASDSVSDSSSDASLPSCATAAWTRSVIDSPAHLTYGGPSIGANGTTIRVATPESQSSKLRVSTLTAGVWNTEAFDAGIFPKFVSHVIDGAGVSHIAVYDGVVGPRLVEGQPGSFALAALTTVGAVANLRGMQGETLVQDSVGTLHLFYVNGSNDLVDAVRPVGGMWTNTTVASGMREAWMSAVADQTTVNIAYMDAYSTPQFWQMYFATKASSAAWAPSPLVAMATQPSITVDANRGIHVSYTTSPASDLIHAYRADGSAWTFETVDSQGSVGAESRIAIDDLGALHILYIDSINGLKEAVRPAGATNWIVRVVDPGGSKGDLFIGRDGTAYVAYYNTAESAVKWASRPRCQ